MFESPLSQSLSRVEYGRRFYSVRSEGAGNESGDFSRRRRRFPVLGAGAVFIPCGVKAPAMKAAIFREGAVVFQCWARAPLLSHAERGRKICGRGNKNKW
jgi:hypothetical protein